MKTLSFHWLPAEVIVDENGKARIVSEINNLKENRYPELYDKLSRLIEVMLPGYEKV